MSGAPHAKPLSRDEILDAALSLGDVCGWEKLTLHDIAQHLDTSLAAIKQQVAQKDDLVDAWLDRADAAALAQFPLATAQDQISTTVRLKMVIQAWLDALAPHHKLTGEMLLYKLEPGHVHLQAAGILRISRTVQWFREAAGLKASHLQRIGQEVALSSLFVGIFVYWLNDRSKHQAKTRKRLAGVLHQGHRIRLWK